MEVDILKPKAMKGLRNVSKVVSSNGEGYYKEEDSKY